jgi:hypothetical protein
MSNSCGGQELCRSHCARCDFLVKLDDVAHVIVVGGYSGVENCTS